MDHLETLLKKTCFVIDFLPRRVGVDDNTEFFEEAEQFFLHDLALERIAESFTNINPVKSLQQ